MVRYGRAMIMDMPVMVVMVHAEGRQIDMLMPRLALDGVPVQNGCQQSRHQDEKQRGCDGRAVHPSYHK